MPTVYAIRQAVQGLYISNCAIPESSVRYTAANSVRLYHRILGSIPGGIIIFWGIPKS